MPANKQNERQYSRRNFLKVGALGSFGLSLPMVLAHRQSLAAAGKPTKDVNVILVYTTGGTSHIDTFDPKPNAPQSIRGVFNPISTKVPGVQFSELLPRMASEINRFALLRSWHPLNAGHGMAEHLLMSGRIANPTTVYPCYGSVLSHQKGYKSPLPPFVQLGDVNRSNQGGTAGILGPQYNPFEILSDPNEDDFTVRDITPPIAIERIARRKRMLDEFDALQRTKGLQPQPFKVSDVHYKTALKMISAKETKEAFRLDREPEKMIDAYGKNPFGQRLLLARRLIESGVRFVTVSDGGWDTHSENFVRMREAVPYLDQGFPQLLIDLEQRGMLDTTLVCWFTDFGRTPQINIQSGRDHWPSAGFAIMAGAGIPGGSVVGATDDKGSGVTKDPYIGENLAATVYQKLGLPLDLTVMAGGRRIRLIDAKPIKQWS